jgi:hypothetical protein
LAGALLVSAWTAIVKDRRILGGVLLGLATFKPQLALLPVIWLLLEREWKVLAIGSTTAMVMSVPAFIASGVSGSYVEWCSMLGIARDKAVFEGIWAETEWRRFFIAAGLPLPDLLLVAPAATLAVWMVRDRIVLDDRYPLILGIAFQFIYLHDGDLMAISPMASSYLRRLRGKASGWLAVALLLVLCTPQRLLRRSGVDALAHIRIPALALLWAWLLVMALQERRLNTPVDSPNALPPPA